MNILFRKICSKRSKMMSTSLTGFLQPVHPAEGGPGGDAQVLPGRQAHPQRQGAPPHEGERSALRQGARSAQQQQQQRQVKSAAAAAGGRRRPVPAARACRAQGSRPSGGRVEGDAGRFDDTGVPAARRQPDRVFDEPASGY